MTTFYAYLYSIDGIPEYAGKGNDNRFLDHIWPSARTHWANHLKKSIRVQRDVRCTLFVQESEDAASAFEIALIAKYGRRDLGTGTLYNKTNGGEGPSGYKHTPEGRIRSGDGQRGKPSAFKGQHHTDEAKEVLADKALAQWERSDKTNPFANWLGAFKDHHHTDETKAVLAIKAAEQGRQPDSIAHQKTTCPHCGQIGGKMGMARWHFDNCKFKDCD